MISRRSSRAAYFHGTQISSTSCHKGLRPFAVSLKEVRIDPLPQLSGLSTYVRIARALAERLITKDVFPHEWGSLAEQLGELLKECHLRADHPSIACLLHPQLDRWLFGRFRTEVKPVEQGAPVKGAQLEV